MKHVLIGEAMNVDILVSTIRKKLDIPVIALAQVNRSIGARDNKVPTLADLRGSGDLAEVGRAP